MATLAKVCRDRRLERIVRGPTASALTRITQPKATGGPDGLQRRILDTDRTLLLDDQYSSSAGFSSHTIGTEATALRTFIAAAHAGLTAMKQAPMR
jgi:hypothetical protein